MLGPHTVTVLRAAPGAVDDYGNPVTHWESASQTNVSGCSMQPVEGDEFTTGRDTVVSRWRLYAPVRAHLTATDRVRYAGDVYEVDGEVQRWDFPDAPHLTALLRRSRGE